MSEAAAPAAAPSSAAAPAPQATPSSPTPGQPSRGPDGKFAPQKAPEPKPADDDPEIDLGDLKLRRSQLKSELGRARSASKLLTEAKREKEEAAKLRAEQEERKKRYLDDFDAFFEDAGISDRDERAKIVSKYLHKNFIEPESMTAEQRRIAELEAELGKRTKADEEVKKAKEQEEQTRFEQEEAQKLRKQVADFIKAGSLPMSSAAVKRVAERIAAYEERGIELDVGQAAKLVRDELASDTSEILATASVDEMRELWGPEKFKSIASKFIQWGLSQARPAPGQQRAVATPTPAPKPDQFLSPAEFEAMRRSRKP